MCKWALRFDVPGCMRIGRKTRSTMKLKSQGSHFFGLTKFHDFSRFISKYPGIFSLSIKYDFQVVVNINMQTY